MGYLRVIRIQVKRRIVFDIYKDKSQEPNYCTF